MHKYYTDDENEVIEGALAVDAASMNLRKIGKNGFIGYHFQPSKNKYPSRMIHVSHKEKSIFIDDTIDEIRDIQKRAEKEKIRIVMNSTICKDSEREILQQSPFYSHDAEKI